MSAFPLLLSGFSDEIAADKNIDTQFAVMSGLGLRYTTLRFLNVDHQVLNVSQLSDRQADYVVEKLQQYDLQVSSIGSPLGKVKLLDIEDGSSNRFRPFAEYLETEVQRVCQLAQRFGSKLVRGFSFYHPRGTPAEHHLDLAADHLRQMAQRCDDFGLTLGLEIEANLIGQTGQLLAELEQRVDHPALALIFDSANVVVQGYSQEQVLEQWRRVLPGLGWLHVKDYAATTRERSTDSTVDEESLSQFVPVGQGAGGYREIFSELHTAMPTLQQRWQTRGLPGFFVDLEPHLKQGGQFGGFSGADGFGIACRALGELLTSTGWEPGLRDRLSTT